MVEVRLAFGNGHPSDPSGEHVVFQDYFKERGRPFNSFLLLLVRHQLLVAMHLFLVASYPRPSKQVLLASSRGLRQEFRKGPGHQHTHGLAPRACCGFLQFQPREIDQKEGWFGFFFTASE